MRTWIHPNRTQHLLLDLLGRHQSILSEIRRTAGDFIKKFDYLAESVELDQEPNVGASETDCKRRELQKLWLVLPER